MPEQPETSQNRPPGTFLLPNRWVVSIATHFNRYLNARQPRTLKPADLTLLILSLYIFYSSTCLIGYILARPVPAYTKVRNIKLLTSISQQLFVNLEAFLSPFFGGKFMGKPAAVI